MIFKSGDKVKLKDNVMLLQKFALQWEKEANPNRVYEIQSIETPISTFSSNYNIKLDDSHDLDYPPEVLVKVL